MIAGQFSRRPVIPIRWKKEIVMHHCYSIPKLVVLVCVSLLCSCKSPSKPSVSEYQVLDRIQVAHDGYAKDNSGVWQGVVLLKNPTEMPIECIIGSFPGAVPEGSRSIGATGLSLEEFPTHLRWNAGVSHGQMPIPMMKRYGMVQTKVLGPQQSERILLPIYVTPSRPGETKTQLFIGIRQGSDQPGPEIYDSYIAELVL